MSSRIPNLIYSLALMAGGVVLIWFLGAYRFVALVGGICALLGLMQLRVALIGSRGLANELSSPTREPLSVASQWELGQHYGFGDTSKAEAFRELEARWKSAAGGFLDLHDQEWTNHAKAAWLSARGGDLARRGMDKQAVADLSEAVQLFPAFTPAYLTLAIVHRDRGRYDEALRVLDAAPPVSYGPGAKKETDGTDLSFDRELLFTSIYGLLDDEKLAIEHARKAVAASRSPSRQRLQSFDESQMRIDPSWVPTTAQDEEAICELEALIARYDTMRPTV